MRYYKHISIICFPLTVLLFLNACRKYLDAKPDSKMEIPSTIKDLRAMLDDVATMNLSWPIAGEVAADNYYLVSNNWSSLSSVTDRDNYIWKADVSNDMDWSLSYRVVFKANVVLEKLNDIVPTPAEQEEWSRLKGSALFYRAFAFYMVTQEFTPPYDHNTASVSPGIPLRLSADVNEISTRASVESTYSTIINDLENAALLLPVNVPYKTRPSRLAVFALLSRVHLTMGDFTKAASYADYCMKNGTQLLDYNDVNPNTDEPLKRFNNEVIFHVAANYSYCLDPSICKVDTTLVTSYTNADLRKPIFYRINSDGSAAFRGNYDGSNSYQLFTGLAADEVFITAAECLARQGKNTEARQILNVFLRTRYDKSTFLPVTETDKDRLLSIILLERRKELPFRGTRWIDLRRLNNAGTENITIRRQINGVVYTLPPHDLRYAMQIPSSVTAIVPTIPKNPR
ncbi:RagB/SusD family nutrient uptake outer membrane protein [Chitinophaga defluvii]|uniref:RagB/SusD family nutrient uptake outer membrane protein n=1 Tax=Chitinophaga defluvii TaxID=3163343 RepID=A0ABV2T499_9BACT